MEPTNNFAPQVPPQEPVMPPPQPVSPPVPPLVPPPSPVTPVPPPPPAPTPSAPPSPSRDNSWKTFSLILLGMIVLGALVCAAIWYMRPSAPLIQDAPTAQLPEATQPIACGGIAGLMCPDGYTCQYEGDYPDAGGTCVR